VIGDGRQDDCGFAAKTLLQHTSATHVLCPQYRLASNPGGRFPSQLQDAITSFLYLIEELKVPANQITISGDSAGGNLCLALLRYIADNLKAAVPSPGCAFLWSPWVDPVFHPMSLQCFGFRKQILLIMGSGGISRRRLPRQVAQCANRLPC